MRQASKRVPDSAEKTVRDIRRATRPPSSVMNSRRLNSSNCIRSPPARATLQDIEWAGISQRVSER